MVCTQAAERKKGGDHVGSEMEQDTGSISERQDELVNLHSQRYRRGRDLEELNDELREMVQGVAVTPEDHLEMASTHQRLGRACTDKYRMNGNLEDLEATLKHDLTAMALTPEGHPGMASRHQNLAISYRHSYQRTGDLEYLEAALKHNLTAVALTPEGHPGMAGRHENLAISYRHRYHRTGDLEYLEAALKHNLTAVALTPEDHPDMASKNHNLAASYSDRYERTGDLEDLEAALKHDLTAMALTPEGHPGMAGRHEDLAISYRHRYHRTGDLEYLEAALKHNLTAVALTPEGHPDMPGRYQCMSASYTDRYRRAGDLEDLEAALKHDLTAVALTPEGHPGMAGRHQNLAISYRHSYQRTGDLEYLEAAHKHNLTAVALTPKGHPGMAGRHTNLAISYRHRYQRTGDLEYLEAALKHNLTAVALTPEGHPDMPGRYQCISASYTDRYRRAGDLDDLEAALKHDLTALALTPEGHVDMASRNHNLAVSYTDRYKGTGDLEDLEAALKHNLTAMALTSEGHPDMVGRLKNLATSYIQRYRRIQDLKDLTHANKLFTLGFKSFNASPQDIWSLATSFTMIDVSFPPQDILEAYSTALGTLPSLLWLGSSLRSRHNALVRYDVSTFISHAVSFALKASNPTLAIEFIEQGLSTTHKNSLQLRDEHTILQTQLPALSQKLHQVSLQLQGFSHTSNSTLNYHTLVHERQNLIAKIRNHPGFEDFLSPPSYSNLCLAAKNGPVIMLNYIEAEDKADAILIIKPELPPIHLSLPGVKPGTIKKQQINLKNALEHLWISSRSQGNRGLSETQRNYKAASDLLKVVIDWIWTSIVKPVFEVLAKYGITDGRLWWCPSGPFTYLPLHAAVPLKQNTFIQSYIPTLDILVHAHSSQASRSGNDMLTAIGVSETLVEGTWCKIPNVESELETVVSLFGGQSKQLQGPQASMENVVNAMQSSSWLHLACHGEQVPGNPLQSGLILHEEKLNLSQILNLDLPKAKFVYLSACETAMGDGQLENEAMHLAGGFLSAGFQGAIGTLWSIGDVDGPNVAEMVYQKILGENRAPDVTMAAEGLHLAIQQLRKNHVHPSRWMPFIHFGV